MTSTLVDTSLWYTNVVAPSAASSVPTNCNAISDTIHIDKDNGAVPGPSASYCLMYFDAYLGTGHDAALHLISDQSGANYFEAEVDGARKFQFTTPVVVGHKYKRELKIKTGPKCHFVLQDLTATSVETHDENITAKFITGAEDGVAWHNLDAATPFLAKYACTVTAYGGSTNGGTSYTDFKSPFTIYKDSVFGGSYDSYLGPFSINGNSEGTGPAGTGIFYDVANDTTAPVKLYAGAPVVRFGAYGPGAGPLENKTIKTVVAYMSKLGSPTGTIFCRARYDDDSIVQGCEASMDASTLTTTSQPYTFVFPAPAFNFPDENLAILIEYAGTGSNSTNCVQVDEAQTDKFAEAESAYYSGTAYTFNSAKDFCGQLSTSPPAPGTTPPGTGGGSTGSTGGGGGGNVAAGDLRFFYSGGIGNTVGDFSLGGGPSDHEIGSYVLDNLFDNVTDGEAKDGTAGEYRLIYMRNINQQTQLHTITLWSPTGGSVSPDTFFYFGLAVAPVNGVEGAIPLSTAAPPGVNFAEYPDMTKPLAVPDLPAGGFQGLWVWRKVKANARTFSRDQAILEADYYQPPPPATTGGGGGTTPVCPDGYTYDPPTGMCVRGSGGTGTSALKTGHGVNLLYSTLGGDRYFELMNKSQPNISQVDFQSTLSEVSGTKPNVSFKVSSQDQVRVEVGTVDTPGGFNDQSGAHALACLDTAFLAKQGYMATPKDWRNFEAQWYLLVHSYSGSTSSGEAHMELEGRCAFNSTDSTAIGDGTSCKKLGRWCESTKYNTNAYFTGRVKFEKCLQHTNGYSSHNPEKTGALSPANWKGVWTGFKCVYYNIPGSTNVRGTGPQVKVEMYADQGDNSTAPSNQWKKVIEAIDDGSGNVFSGPRGSYVCGSDHLIPVSWGGPLAIFRWDHLDAEFRWLSIYELDPAVKPAGSGGTGPDVVPPISGGGTSGTTSPPSTTPVGSARLDYITIAQAPPASSAVTPMDVVTVQMSAQIVQTLTNPENPDNIGLQIISGNASYGLAGYCSIASPWVKGVYGNSPNNEMLSAYWDDANGACVTPGANSTIGSKKGSKNIVHDSFGPKMTDGPNIYLIFWGSVWSSQTSPFSMNDVITRVRDYLLNRDLVYWSKLSQYGINTLPKWGKSCINTTTPVPSNAQVSDSNIRTAIHDSIQRGQVDSPVLVSNGAIYILITPGTVTQVTDSQGNVGASNFGYYQYDSSSSTPGQHNPSGGSTTLFQIFAAGPNNTPRQLYSGATTRFGWVVNAGSVMLNEDPLTLVGFYLAKGGAPTGTVSYTIRDSADNLKFTMGTLDAANDIVSTTTPELHLLRNELNTYQLQVGDKILCEYNSGSSSNYVKVDEMPSNGFFDGALTPSDAYSGTTYTQTTTKCPAGQLWSGYVITSNPPEGAAISSVAAPTPGPPDTIIYDLGSNNTPNNMYSGSYVRCGQKIVTSSSILYGKKITQVGFYIKRNNSPTGTGYARLRKGSDDSIACEFGSIDVSTLTGSMALYLFTNITNTYVTTTGDRILFEYGGGDSTNRPALDNFNSSTYDGTNSQACRYISSYDDSHTDQDTSARVWISSTTVGGSSGAAQPDTVVYQQALQNSTISLDSAAYTRYGELLNSSSSVLIGAVLTQIDVFLKKTGSPTGNMSLLIRDNTDAIKATFTTTFDVSTLTTTLTSYSFQLLTNTYALQNGDRILLEYSGGDASNNVQIDRGTGGSGPDSTNTCSVNYSGTSYGIPGSAANDLSGTFWTTGVGAGAPPAQPAPFTTVYDVSPSNVNHLSFNSSQRRQGQYVDTGSSLIGKVITRLTLYVDRWSGGSGTLTGAIYKPDGTLAVTMGTVNVTSLPSNDNDQGVQFTNTANTYALEKGSFVSIEHSLANSTIDGVRNGSDTISKSYVKWNNGSGSWGQATNNDYAGTMETGGV